MVRTWRFHWGGLGSIRGQGTKIPQAAQRGQNKIKLRIKNKKKRNEEMIIYNNLEISHLWGGVTSMEKDPGGIHREFEWFLVTFWFLN